MRYAVGLLGVVVVALAGFIGALWMRVGTLEQEVRYLRTDVEVVDGGLRATDEIGTTGSRAKLVRLDQRISDLEKVVNASAAR